MNYEDMSDFEVNKLVSNFIDLIFTFNDTDETVYICEKDGAWNMVPISYFNPCNNPSDAWPIIASNGICINFRKGKTSLVGIYGECPDECEYGGEFRAAMICFLNMKDTEK
ncbi:NinX [Vibrio phage 1.113.A._10N.286.51.E7]|nr:NinX [Vibrio phage 1.113.A._10N.286.51.E7]